MQGRALEGESYVATAANFAVILKSAELRVHDIRSNGFNLERIIRRELENDVVLTQVNWTSVARLQISQSKANKISCGATVTLRPQSSRLCRRSLGVQTRRAVRSERAEIQDAVLPGVAVLLFAAQQCHVWRVPLFVQSICSVPLVSLFCRLLM